MRPAGRLRPSASAPSSCGPPPLANFQKARQAVDEYFTKVSESKLLNVPGLQPLRKELLESSRKYYQEFLKDHADDPSVRAEAAEAWYRVGFVTMDVDSAKESLDSFQKAAEMYEQLTRDHPRVERFLYKFAMCLNDLGNQQSALGREAEARRSHERCLALRQQIVHEHPDVAEYRKELGIGHLVWASRQSYAGLVSESLRSSERGRDVFELLVREHPDVADYQWRLSECPRGHRLAAGRARALGRGLADARAVPRAFRTISTGAPRSHRLPARAGKLVLLDRLDALPAGRPQRRRSGLSRQGA